MPHYLENQIDIQTASNETTIVYPTDSEAESGTARRIFQSAHNLQKFKLTFKAILTDLQSFIRQTAKRNPEIIRKLLSASHKGKAAFPYHRKAKILTYIITLTRRKKPPKNEKEFEAWQKEVISH